MTRMSKSTKIDEGVQKEPRPEKERELATITEEEMEEEEPRPKEQKPLQHTYRPICVPQVIIEEYND